MSSDVTAPSDPDAQTVDVSVVVPTYEEAENLPLLVPRVSAALTEAGLTHEVLVIDDNSPDATKEVCAQLAEEHPVRLVVRTTDRGLSPAVIRGFQEARGEYVVVMDADLSHPPEKVPALVEALRRPDVDMVIGSRYVKGGSTDEEWGVFRWLNSKVATLLARPLTSARDPMAGFFGMARTTFEGAKVLNPVGYKIGLELIVKCGCKNIVEVPIHFRDREHGESKLNLREQFNYLRHLKRLYEFKLGRAAKPIMFGMIGASGMVVDLAVLALLLPVLPFGTARAIAIGVAMTTNFWLNRRVTFSYARRESVVKQYALFVLSCSMGAATNWGVSVALREAFPFFLEHPLVSAMCGVAAGAVVNYLLADRIAFRIRSG